MKLWNFLRESHLMMAEDLHLPLLVDPPTFNARCKRRRLLEIRGVRVRLSILLDRATKTIRMKPQSVS